MVTKARMDSNDILKILWTLYKSINVFSHLTLSNSAWIYTNDESMRRCLVVQYKAPKKKEDSKQEDIDKAKIKKMRDLGVKAAG